MKTKAVECMPCVLSSSAFTETIDKKLLEKLLSNPNLLTKWTDEYGEHDDKQQLINILTSIKGSSLTVKYNYSKKAKNFGRVYAEGSLSLGCLQRKIRGTLAKGTYIDIDISNAHPNMILHFLKKNGFKHSSYEKYCMDRETYLNKVMNASNCSRGEAKRFFISAGNGGKYRSWLFNLPREEAKGPIDSSELCNLWAEFSGEAVILANKFIDTNRERYDSWLKKRTKKYNEVFGFLAIMLQDYERQILEVMYNYMDEINIVKHNNTVLCHDGIMVKMKPTNPNIGKILRELEETIEEKLEFKLKLEVKPLEHHLDNMIDSELIAEGDSMDLNYFKSLLNYAEKKEYFERYLCQIMDTSQFKLLNIKYNRKGLKVYSHKTLSEKSLITSFKAYESHKLFSKEDVKKGKAPAKFIDKWLNDPDKRTYLHEQWIPYNGVYKQEGVNTFNLFTGYSTQITGPLPMNAHKHIKPFLDVLFNLCEANEQCLEFTIHYLAHIIQFPERKLPYSIIFKGNQGTGKDTILAVMKKIIGDQYINSDSKVENFLGTHAVGLCEKILVAFNESEGHKTADFEGIIKSLITDDTMTVNKKYQDIYKAVNIARMLVFSNKENPFKFDAATAERRFLAFRTTDKYLKNSKFWSAFYNHIDTPEFAISLYNYLCNINVEDYDFEKERKKSLTITYYEMAQAQLTPAIEWIGDFVSQYKDCGYNDKQKLGQDEVWAHYIKWQSKYRPDTSKETGYVGTLKKLKSNLKGVTPFVFKRVGGNRKVCEFTPNLVYEFLAHKNWVSGLDIADDEESEEGVVFSIN